MARSALRQKRTLIPFGMSMSDAVSMGQDQVAMPKRPYGRATQHVQLAEQRKPWSATNTIQRQSHLQVPVLRGTTGSHYAETAAFGRGAQKPTFPRNVNGRGDDVQN